MSDIIVSASGVRGIIGDNLTPQNIIKFTSSFAEYLKKKTPGKSLIVVGRDGRLYGDKVSDIVIGNLILSGYEVRNLGIVPTPTVQIAVEGLKSAGGISITASHNSQIWNGLKFLDSEGTFLDNNHVKELLQIAETGKFFFAELNKIKSVTNDYSWLEKHLDKVLGIKLIDKEKIRARKFKIVVDAVNASGSVIVCRLLEKLGCIVVKLFCDGSGKFPHDPEPVPANLILLSKAVKKHKADLGIAVDPDSDRLVLITDKGEPFSEESTITTAVNFVLRKSKIKNKNVTVNLSTTRAVDDIAAKYNAKVFRSPVGEINVVKEMKRNNSIIGGEGSGGVIYPALHYGRDSIVGIAFVLSEFAGFDGTVSQYKELLPRYFITKTKISNVRNADKVLNEIETIYSTAKDVVRIWKNDGLKIEFKNSWVHMRRSNTEPIIRIIAEAVSMSESQKLQSDFRKLIQRITKNTNK